MLGSWLQSPTAPVVVSFLWGLGLALLFRRSCQGRRCIVVESPPFGEVEGRLFRYDGDASCYAYDRRQVECPAARSDGGAVFAAPSQ